MFFRKISFFISKSILSKVFLKYQVSMLAYSSVYAAYLKSHFRIMRTVNPLSQLYINRKFQNYICVSICHCHRASFMRSLFIAFKSNEWFNFVVHIGSPVFFLFYCVCVVSFYFSAFSYFLWSPLLAEVLT